MSPGLTAPAGPYAIRAALAQIVLEEESEQKSAAHEVIHFEFRPGYAALGNDSGKD